MGNKAGLADTGCDNLAPACHQQVDGLLKFVGYINGGDRLGFFADDPQHVFLYIQRQGLRTAKGAHYTRIETIL